MGACSARPNHPSLDHITTHTNFTEFIEVAPGFWNYRTDFHVSILNLKVCRVYLCHDSHSAEPFSASLPLACP